MRDNCSLYSIIVVNKVVNCSALRILDAAHIFSGMVLCTKRVVSGLCYKGLGKQR